MMVNQDLINLIKSSTIALGLVKKGENNPQVIVGSGFLFDSTGYFITASHVAQQCKDLHTLYQKKNIEMEVVMITETSSKDKVGFSIGVVDKFTLLEQENIPEGSSIPKEIDVACGMPKAKLAGLPFLKIKESSKLTVFDEVLMCGSSGSPILDIEGDVVAIAQAVIPTSVTNNNNWVGSANMGLVHGVTHWIFSEFVKSTKKYYDTGIKDPTPIPIPHTILKIPEFIRDDSKR